MFQLHQDLHFHYETLRSLGLAPYGGSDIRETLEILPYIKPGDFEDWYREWHDLALRVLSTIDESKLESYSPVTLRNVYLRASHYFFESDFFTHGNPTDPRGDKAFELWRAYFDKANALLPIPGVHVSLPTAHGFEIPIIIYRAAEASASNPRPTLIIGGGFDSNMEETFHTFGFAALERGYNVILYEGPGQPTLLHEQKVGFIAEWEKAVTPIVDYFFTHQKDDISFIETSKIGLIGLSLGGYLSARAAAFEPRLAAVVCIDGVWSLNDALLEAFPDAKQAWVNQDAESFDRAFEDTSPSSSTTRRWMHDHLKFSFHVDSGYAAMEIGSAMNLEGVAQKIRMPAFIGEAEDDIFFQGQPAKVANAIGSNATLVPFGPKQAAQAHCASGALVYQNQVVMEWFAEIVGDKRA